MPYVENLFDDRDTAVDPFDTILSNTLEHEGGFTVDHAGPTNKGITQSTFDKYRASMDLPSKSVKDLGDDEVYDIYRSEYYEGPKISELPEKVAGVVFDFGVNSSPDRAIKTLQRTVGAKPDGVIGPKTLESVNKFVEEKGEDTLVNDVINKREGFLKQLVQDKPEKYKKFENGWKNRLDTLRQQYGKVAESLNPLGSPAQADEIPAEELGYVPDLFDEKPKIEQQPTQESAQLDFVPDLFDEPKKPLFSELGDNVNNFIKGIQIGDSTLGELGSKRGKTDLERIVGQIPEVTIDGVKKSFERGVASAQIDQASYLALIGELDYKKHVKPLKDAQQKIIDADPVKGKNVLSQAIYSVAEMLPAMGVGIVEGAATGAIAGGAAVAGGVTAPLAGPMYIAGQTAGSFEYWRRQGAGQSYAEMREQGIPDSVNKPISLIAGSLYGAVEFSQVDKLIPGSKETAKKLISDSLKKTIGRMAVKYGANWAQEVGEEGIQEIVMSSAKEVSAKVAGQSDKGNVKILQDVMMKGWEATRDSALPMLLLMAPGVASDVKNISDEEKIRAEVRKGMVRQVIAEAKAEEEKQSLVEGISVNLPEDLEEQKQVLENEKNAVIKNIEVDNEAEKPKLSNYLKDAERVDVDGKTILIKKDGPWYHAYTEDGKQILAENSRDGAIKAVKEKNNESVVKNAIENDAKLEEDWQENEGEKYSSLAEEAAKLEKEKDKSGRLEEIYKEQAELKQKFIDRNNEEISNANQDEEGVEANTDNTEEAVSEVEAKGQYNTQGDQFVDIIKNQNEDGEDQWLVRRKLGHSGKIYNDYTGEPTEQEAIDSANREFKYKTLPDKEVLGSITKAKESKDEMERAVASAISGAHREIFDLKQKGATDEEIKEMLGEYFGIWAGVSNISWSGGKDPKVNIGFVKSEKKTIKGKALIDMVRKITGIKKSLTSEVNKTPKVLLVPASRLVEKWGVKGQGTGQLAGTGDIRKAAFGGRPFTIDGKLYRSVGHDEIDGIKISAVELIPEADFKGKKTGDSGESISTKYNGETYFDGDFVYIKALDEKKSVTEAPTAESVAKEIEKAAQEKKESPKDTSSTDKVTTIEDYYKWIKTPRGWAVVDDYIRQHTAEERFPGIDPDNIWKITAYKGMGGSDKQEVESVYAKREDGDRVSNELKVKYGDGHHVSVSPGQKASQGKALSYKNWLELVKSNPEIITNHPREYVDLRGNPLVESALNPVVGFTPIKVWARTSSNRQGDMYSLFFNEKPSVVSGETALYLGEIKSEEQYQRISYMNGKASIPQLKLEFEGQAVVEKIGNNLDVETIANDLATRLNQKLQPYHMKIAQAIVDKDADKLSGWIATAESANKNSRAVFVKYTGVNLPSTIQGKREAIYKWAGQEMPKPKEKAPEPPKMSREDATKKMLDAKAEKVLQTKLRYQGQIMTKKEMVDSLVAKGWVPVVSEQPKIKDVSRRAYNNMDGRQQAEFERRQREAGTKQVYYLEDKKAGVMVEVGKVGYDYAQRKQVNTEVKDLVSDNESAINFYNSEVKTNRVTEKTAPNRSFNVGRILDSVKKMIGSKVNEVFIPARKIAHIFETRPKVSDFIINNIDEILNTDEIYRNVNNLGEIRDDNSFLFVKRMDRNYIAVVEVVIGEDRNEIRTIFTKPDNEMKRLEPFRIRASEVGAAPTTPMQGIESSAVRGLSALQPTGKITLEQESVKDENQKAFKYATEKADELFKKEGISKEANRADYNTTLSQFVDDYFDLNKKEIADEDIQRSEQAESVSGRPLPVEEGGTDSSAEFRIIETEDGLELFDKNLYKKDPVAGKMHEKQIESARKVLALSTDKIYDLEGTDEGQTLLDEAVIGIYSLKDYSEDELDLISDIEADIVIGKKGAVDEMIAFKIFEDRDLPINQMDELTFKTMYGDEKFGSGFLEVNPQTATPSYYVHDQHFFNLLDAVRDKFPQITALNMPLAIKELKKFKTPLEIYKKIKQAPVAIKPELERAKIEDDKMLKDFGQKIGGARKDTAERGYGKTTIKKDTSTPVWMKKYIAAEKVDKSGWVLIKKDAPTWMITNVRDSSQVFSTQEEAEKAIPIKVIGETHRVYQNKAGKWEIFKKVGDRKLFKVVNKEFDNREDAMKHMALNAEDILNIKTTFGEEILPVPEIAVRKGVERRNGNATPEMFMDTFAPKGIEFGNWNNQDERQLVLNHAYDGLLDLADILGIKPKDLMLNGELSIAFGARGQGLSGAKAHFEPDYAAINLTKMKGAGSLAHEWFHALDNYLAKLDGKAKTDKVKNERGDLVFPYRSNSDVQLSFGSSYNSKLDKDLLESYTKLINTLFKKAQKYVENTETADKFLGTARDYLKEKLDNIRRSLAKDYSAEYTWRKNKKGLGAASAEQLAEFDRLSDILIEGGNLEIKFMKIDGLKNNWGGRQSNDTLESMNNIIKAVRNRSGFDTKGDGSLDGVSAAMRTYASRLAMFKDAQNSTEKIKNVPTNYAIEAKKMDQARTGEYWSQPNEMIARAFAAYVEDKVAQRGWQSDFIVYHAHGGIIIPMIDGFVGRPYPEGAEREAITKELDTFVKKVKTVFGVKETLKPEDKGVSVKVGDNINYNLGGRDQTGVVASIIQGQIYARADGATSTFPVDKSQITEVIPQKYTGEKPKVKRNVEDFTEDEYVQHHGNATGLTNDELRRAYRQQIFEITKNKLKGSSSNASIGTFAEEIADGTATEQVEGKTEVEIKPIDNIEIIKIIKILTGDVPTIKKFRKEGKMGDFSGIGNGSIRLSPELFMAGNEKQLAGTIKHEFGHLADFMPDGTLKRGNIFGRMASLMNYLKTTLPKLESQSLDTILKPADRRKIRRQAEAKVGPRPAQDNESDLAAWKAEVSYEYAEMIIAETADRGLIAHKDLRDELIRMSFEWRPIGDNPDPAYLDYRNSSKELYADAMSALLNNPGYVKTKAPIFYETFFEYIDRKPEFKKEYLFMQQILQGKPADLAEIRLEDRRTMYAKGDSEREMLDEEAKAAKKNFWQNIRQMLDDRFYPITRKLSRSTRDGVVPSSEAVHLLREQGMWQVDAYKYVQDIGTKAIEPMLKTGATTQDLGDYQYLRRVIGKSEIDKNAEIAAAINSANEELMNALRAQGFEITDNLKDREQKANPLGYTPASAREALDYLKTKMTPDQWASIEAADKKYREITFKIVQQAADEGVYNKKVFEEIILPNKDTYASFGVIDYITENVAAGVKASKGTLKEIESPLITTTLKTVSLIRLIARNRATKATIDELSSMYPGDVVASKKMFNAAGPTGYMKAPQGKGQVKYLVDGKVVSFDVDPYIAKSFENDNMQLIEVAAAFNKWTGNSIFRNLVITFNPAFQVFNSVRDFGRTYINANALLSSRGKTATIADTLKAYYKGIPLSVKRNMGIQDPVLDKMMANKALGIPFNDFNVDERDDGLARIQRKYKVIGEKIDAVTIREKIVRGWTQIDSGVRFVGNVIETLPKVAGYNLLKDKGVSDREIGYMTRTYIGTPDMLTSGNHTKITNQIFPFSNVSLQGIKSDMVLAVNPTTAAGWHLANFKISILPMLAMAAAILGFMGRDLEEWFEKVPEFDKANYIIIPMGVDKNGRARYGKIPHNQQSRILTAILYKIITSKHNKVDMLSGGIDITASQTPSLAPVLTTIGAWGAFLQHNTPMDMFRGRPILSEQTMRAGGLPAITKMVQWTFNNYGFSQFTTYDDRRDTTFEAVMKATPFVSALTRIIKTSDYGLVERSRAITEEGKGESAARNLQRSELFDKRLKGYSVEDINRLLDEEGNFKRRSQLKEDLQKISYQIYGPNPDKDDLKTTEKAFIRYALKEYNDPYIKGVLSSQSNEAKIQVLKEAKDALPSARFYAIVNKLRKTKTISKEVVNALR